jgi:type I restriction enzyme M protein
MRWNARAGSELARTRSEQSFCVSKDEIAAQGYDLSLNRYKEILLEDANHRAPLEILAELTSLENDLRAALQELEILLQ